MNQDEPLIVASVIKTAMTGCRIEISPAGRLEVHSPGCIHRPLT